MEQQLCYDILRIIFQHLESSDLYRASQVCRFWAEVVNEENFARGPACIVVEKKFSVQSNNSDLMKNDLISDLPIIPGFLVIITVQPIISNSSFECHCKYLPQNCYSLLTDIFYPTPRGSITMNMSLPNSKRIPINTYTFLMQSKPQSVYCPELNFKSSSIFKLPAYIKTQFERYFVENSVMKSCMILFCDMNSVGLLKNFITLMQKWFPNSKLSIWVVLTRAMYVCKTFHLQRKCRAIVSCLSVFISNKNLETWTLTWPLFPRNKEIVKLKLEAWKQEVILKKHSLAILYTSVSKILFSDWAESYLFSIIFPQVPFVELLGSGAIMGEGFKAILEKIQDWKDLSDNSFETMGGDHITILILTYA